MKKAFSVTVLSWHLSVVFLAVLAVLAGMSGCSSDRCTCPTCWEDVPQIAFAYTHYNAAWGHIYAAWFVDYTGSVFTIAALGDDADRLWRIESDGLLTLAELEFLEQEARQVGSVVDAGSVGTMRKLVAGASRGVLTGHQGHCADCGVVSYLGLMRDFENLGYRTVLLYQDGDSEVTNDSPEAARLHEWLKGIEGDVPSPWGEHPGEVAG